MRPSIRDRAHRPGSSFASWAMEPNVVCSTGTAAGGRRTESEWAVRADGECEIQLTDTPRWETGAEWHGGGHGGLGC